MSTLTAMPPNQTVEDFAAVYTAKLIKLTVETDAAKYDAAVQSLAFNYFNELKAKDYATSTVVRYTGQLLELIKAQLEQRLQDALPVEQRKVEAALTIVFPQFSLILSYERKALKRQLDTRQSAIESSRNEQGVTVNISEALKFAYYTLSNLESARWEDISIALALATGRRMAEIHYSASFEPSDEFEVIFTGQLKAKSGKLEHQSKRWVIPTLLPSLLVIKGLEKLAELGKRVDSYERVNTLFQKPLNTRMRLEVWKHFESFTVTAEGKQETIDCTYHKNRAVWFAAVTRDLPKGKWLVFGRDYLGDKLEVSTNAYRYIEVSPESLVRASADDVEGYAPIIAPKPARAALEQPESTQKYKTLGKPEQRIRAAVEDINEFNAGLAASECIKVTPSLLSKALKVNLNTVKAALESSELQALLAGNDLLPDNNKRLKALQLVTKMGQLQGYIKAE